MLKLLEKNKKSNDFMSSEYLTEVLPIGNKNNRDIFTLKTNKYIYKLELPYKNKYDCQYGCIHNYTDNVKTICQRYNINTKYYFNDNVKDNNILPFDTSYFSEIGKYLPFGDYSHTY